MPSAAKENSKEGAVAFVKYYVELINHAQGTGDVEDLARAESEGCISCASGRKFLTALYSKGGHIEGGDIRIRVLSALANSALAGWTIDAELTFGPQQVVRPWKSEPVERLKGGSTVATFFVERSPNAWTLANWTRSS